MQTQSHSQPPGLHRVIGLRAGILLVAGIMIGSGAFKKIAPMSALLHNEGYIIAAWIVAGLITILGALMLNGFAGITTDSGGVYEYLRLSVGNFFSFLYGWAIFAVIGSGAIAALAFIFAQSLTTLFPVPDLLSSVAHVRVAGFIEPFAASGVKLVATVTICVLTWINCRGTKYGKSLNTVVTCAKILGLILLIVLGFFFAGPPSMDHVSDHFAPATAGGAMFSAFFGAMLSAFWAYDGWANLSFVTGEIKNPQKNVPLAILGGVLLAMSLYVLVNWAFMRVLPLDELAAVDQNHIAASVVAERLIGVGGKVLVSSLIALSTFGALNACIIVYPRIYFRMAQQGFFFRSTARIHPVFHTPHVAIICSAVWSIALVTTGTFDMLTNLVIFAGFIFFMLLAIGLMRLKKKGVIRQRIIGYPITPVFIILFSLALIINTLMLQMRESLFGVLLLLTGVPVYFYFRKRISSRADG